MKKILIFASLIFVILPIVACGEVDIKEEKVYIGLNEQQSLETNGNVSKWDSDDTSIVKVNNEGEITGVSDGTATVTATSSLNKTDSVKVEVASIIGNWEYQYVISQGQKYKNADLRADIDIENKKMKMYTYSTGDTFDGTWSFAGVQEGYKCYTFNTNTTFDFEIVVKGDEMYVAPEKAADILTYVFIKK